MTVNNMQDFLVARKCGEEDFSQVKRSTYKYTSCGAWIAEEDQGVRVGSIVEGCDWGTETHELNYPFEIDCFWKALELVEKEAKEIWNDTHGCEDCHDHPQVDEWGNEREFGAWPINPECKTCNGEGSIL
tara:strand:- start:102 stop:491 length:390 start_codon:yes stop_codon:yes gene_type:complete